MEHIAILRRGILEQILSGKKTIESRWYFSRRLPWNKIRAGETIYFKETGKPVTAKAIAESVFQSELTPEKTRELIDKFSEGIGIRDKEAAFQKLIGKKYCILVFLKKSEKIQPFEIDKKGFGAMSAWISVESIDRIRKRK